MRPEIGGFTTTASDRNHIDGRESGGGLVRVIGAQYQSRAGFLGQSCLPTREVIEIIFYPIGEISGLDFMASGIGGIILLWIEQKRSTPLSWVTRRFGPRAATAIAVT